MHYGMCVSMGGGPGPLGPPRSAPALHLQVFKKIGCLLDAGKVQQRKIHHTFNYFLFFFTPIANSGLSRTNSYCKIMLLSICLKLAFLLFLSHKK